MMEIAWSGASENEIYLRFVCFLPCFCVFEDFADAAEIEGTERNDGSGAWGIWMADRRGELFRFTFILDITL